MKYADKGNEDSMSAGLGKGWPVSVQADSQGNLASFEGQGDVIQVVTGREPWLLPLVSEY